MKQLYIVIVFICLLPLAASAQTHTDPSGGFALVGDGFSYKFETHYINVPGANYLRLSANVSATDIGFAQIQIYSYDHQTNYGTLAVSSNQLGQTLTDKKYYFIPNNCAIHLTVYAIGTAFIVYGADPMGITFSYDQAGNRTQRNIVYLTGSSKKSLRNDSEVLSEIQDEIKEEREFRIYPNPSTQHVFVSLNNEALEFKESRIIMFDNLGRQILNQQANQEIIQLDLSGLANGFYIIKLVYGSKAEECIVIKE